MYCHVNVQSCQRGKEGEHAAPLCISINEGNQRNASRKNRASFLSMSPEGAGEGTKKKKKNTHEHEAMQSEWVRELVPGLSDVFLSKKVCSHSVSQTEK